MFDLYHTLRDVFAVAAIVLAAATLSGIAPLPAVAQTPAAKDKATPVRVDTVRRVEAQRTAPVLGRLVPLRAGEVAARTQGPVADMLVDVGDRVQQGDVMAVIDAERLAYARDQAAAAVAQRRADAAEAQAQLELARVQLRRLEGLRQSSAFNQSRFDEAQQNVARWNAAVQATQAAVRTAEAQLALAEAELKDAAVTAPYAGVVTRRHTEVGSYIRTGEPVVSLINDTRLEVEADVPVAWLSGLAPGTRVTAVIDGPGGRREWPATVRALVPDENPRTRTRVVRFTLAAPDGTSAPNLAANQVVALDLPVGEAEATLAVDKDAVIAGPEGHIVFVVEDGVARSRAVEIGDAVGNRFVVRSGLKDGDVVVVRGNERLRSGQPVLPLHGNGAPAAAAEQRPATAEGGS